jgi:hypothetical protein
MPPTKALTSTSSENCAQLSRNPNSTLWAVLLAFVNPDLWFRLYILVTSEELPGLCAGNRREKRAFILRVPQWQ